MRGVTDPVWWRLIIIITIFIFFCIKYKWMNGIHVYVYYINYTSRYSAGQTAKSYHKIIVFFLLIFSPLFCWLYFTSSHVEFMMWTVEQFRGGKGVFFFIFELLGEKKIIREYACAFLTSSLWFISFLFCCPYAYFVAFVGFKEFVVHTKTYYCNLYCLCFFFALFHSFFLSYSLTWVSIFVVVCRNANSILLVTEKCIRNYVHFGFGFNQP